MLAFSVRVSAFFGVLTSLAHAQCANAWLLDNPIDGPTSIIHSLVVLGPEDFIVAGQVITDASSFVGRSTNGVWSTLGSGTDGSVVALLALPNGDIIAGGEFTTAGGVPANNVARWNGSVWSSLGAGCDNAVRALARLPNGDIVATGFFTSAGGVGANHIARWNGATWSPLGSGLTGRLVVHGDDLVVMPNGDLVVVGTFTTAGGVPANNVALWNGTAWSAMGAGISAGFWRVIHTPNGDVVAAGAGGLWGLPVVVLWDGTSWQVLPAPGAYVYSITALPDGDVLAHASSPGSQARVKRLHGTTWTDVAVCTGAVYALAWADGGEVFAAGWFSQVDGKVAQNFARLRTSCPALAVTNGAGCPSSGGANLLTATSLPWISSVFATSGSGLPANALVAVVRGLSPTSMSLPQVLPQGQPGCVLHVAPDLLDVLVPTNGTATAGIVLPATPALAGQVFREEWVPLELGAGGAIVAVTSTNALTMTIGVF